MKYVKLTQSQLDEIEELLRAKNLTISDLKDSIDDLTRQRDAFKEISERRLETIEELAQFRHSKRNEDTLREELKKAHEVIKEQQVKEKIMNKQINRLNSQLDIVNGTLKETMGLLDEVYGLHSFGIAKADLSNILDELV